MDTRVYALKLWLLLLHVTALSLIHPCSSLGSGPVDPREERMWDEYFSRKYFYAHNETHIAMARAEADEGGAASAHGTSTLSSALGTATFKDFQPSEDGCNFDSLATSDLAFKGSIMWQGALATEWEASRTDDIEILAVDSCTMIRNVNLFVYGEFEITSQRWDAKKANALIRDKPNPNPLSHSSKVLVKLRINNTSRLDKFLINEFGEPDLRLEILADGVYFPATGKMHLVGCTLRPPILPAFDPPPVQVNEISAEHEFRYDPGSYHAPPLNSLPVEDCEISATVQYPPLLCRWNSERVVKYSIRSNREKDDPLYFEPIDRTGFFPYLVGSSRMQSQQRLETGSWILLLVLGLLCIALQIAHGRKNEESLPFVSIVMLAIQLAHHLSQMSIFKDLQIGGYHIRRTHTADGDFPDSISEHNYYGIMAWSEHVPYQAMAMAAIFMYVWLFHKVGDRRRIMKLRVLKRRPSAKNPPSDWRVMFATLAIFSFLCSLGFVIIRADNDGYGHFSRPLTGMTDTDLANYNEFLQQSLYWLSDDPDAAFPPYLERRITPFVPARFYELTRAQWGFVNTLTGLVVSFFLVPQLVGNAQWEFQGRPLSAWFYAGIPFLQSLPHVFLIGKYFQVLPIFSFYDPYMISIYGIYESQAPWWEVGVVLCSALLVLAVHSQFARSLHRHSTPKTSHVQTCDML